MRYVPCAIRAIMVLPALIALIVLSLLSLVAELIGKAGRYGTAVANQHGDPLCDWIEGDWAYRPDA